MAGKAAPPPSAAEIVDAAVPLRCTSQQQCDRWWRAAQVWIANNAGLKLQVATDAVLQTYGSTASIPRWAFTVTREPMDGGVEAIEIRVQCAKGYACTPAYETVIADFKRTLLGVR